MADSAFECVLYKEQTATGTNSVFLQGNSSSLGYCATAGDAVWTTSPFTTASRSNSVMNISMDTQGGKFCGVVSAGVQTNNVQTPNFISISGQNRDCADSTTTKVVERLIEFSY